MTGHNRDPKQAVTWWSFESACKSGTGDFAMADADRTAVQRRLGMTPLGTTCDKTTMLGVDLISIVPRGMNRCLGDHVSIESAGHEGIIARLLL